MEQSVKEEELEGCMPDEKLEEKIKEAGLEMLASGFDEPQKLTLGMFLTSNSGNCEEKSIDESCERNSIGEPCDRGTVVGEQDISEISVNRGRKRRSSAVNKSIRGDRSQWKKEVNKLLRMKGESYIGRSYDINAKVAKYKTISKPARVLQPRCNCHTVGANCQKITEDERQEIFKSVWSMTWPEKQSYIRNLVFSRDITRRRRSETNRRKRTIVFRLISKGELIRVCKSMFLSTTGFTHYYVAKYASTQLLGSSAKPARKCRRRLRDNDSSSKRFENSLQSESNTDPGSCSYSESWSHSESCSNPEPQGHFQFQESVQPILIEKHDPDSPQMPVNSEEPEITFIREFVESLPSMPSRYCQHLMSTKTYLEPVFENYQHLYREFEHHCAKYSIPPPSQQIFSSALKEMNYDIFKPRKSDCDICDVFPPRNSGREQYTQHLQEKELAMVERECDEHDAAKSNGNIKMVFVNLEFVLPSPNLQNSMVYYKEKLYVYNLSFFDVVSKDTVYYVWHEVDGDLSAQEFASCLCHYLENEADFDTCIIYSDPNDYLYRNAIIAIALSYYSQKFGKTVVQKMFVKGHNDTASRTLERKLSVRGQSIHCPADYVRLIMPATIAQQNISQIDVRYVDFDFFKKFLSTSKLKSIKPFSNARDSLIENVKALMFTPDGEVAFKVSFAGDWVKQKLIKSERVNPLREPSPLYKTKRKIGRCKYEHLQELKSLLLPDYRYFYENLPRDLKVS